MDVGTLQFTSTLSILVRLKQKMNRILIVIIINVPCDFDIFPFQNRFPVSLRLALSIEIRNNPSSDKDSHDTRNNNSRQGTEHMQLFLAPTPPWTPTQLLLDTP